MPTLFRHAGFRFFFYSNEGDPREPPHVHIQGTGAEAKFLRHPQVILAQSAGLDACQLRRLAEVVEARRQDIERAWHDYFG